MDERRRERGPHFRKVADDFTVLADALAAIPLDGLGPFQAAAE
jgi:N-formylglutamate deformylase